MSVRARVSSYVSMRVVRDGSLSLIDQSILAASNFATMVLVARSVGPSSFGLFALMFTTLGVTVLVQDSLITTPHTVMGAPKEGYAYRSYTSSVAVLQIALGAATAIVFLASAAATSLFATSTALVLVAAGFAAPSFQLHDFIRRVLFVESRVGAVLVNDVLTYGSRMTMIVLLMWSVGLSTARVLLLLGGTWLAGGILGLWQIRGSLMRAFDRSIAREHWDFGRWILGSHLVLNLPAYVSAAVISSVVSVGAFGAYRAALQLVHVTDIPMNTLNRLIVPRLARDAENGTEAVSQRVAPVMVLGVALLAIFAVGMLIFREPLLRIVYGPKFAAFGAVVVLVAFIPLGTFVTLLQSHQLTAFRRTRAMFIGRLLGLIGGSVVGVLALFWFGMVAAGAVELIGFVIAAIWFQKAWSAIVRDYR